MKIKHEFDSDLLLIILEEFESSFHDKYKLLQIKALEYSRETMSLVNETNRYSFGKVHLKINGIDNITNMGNLFVRIRADPFILETRRIKGNPNKKYQFNQEFYIPVHNRFEKILIEIVTYVTEGWFKGKHKEHVVKEFCIPLPFLKDEPFNNETIRFYLDFEDLKKFKHFNLIQQNIIDPTLNFFDLKEQNADQQAAQPKLEIEI